MHIGLDFDQTIADTRDAVGESLRLLCSEFEIKYQIEEIDKLAVSGLSLRDILSHLGVTDSTASDRFRYHYQHTGVALTKYMYGAEDLLHTISAMGWDLTIISAKTQINLDLSIKKLGLSRIMAYGELHSAGKTKMIKQLGVDAYVGDQVSDVVSANNAEIISVFIGQPSDKWIENQIPDFSYVNLEEMRKNLHLLET